MGFRLHDRGKAAVVRASKGKSLLGVLREPKPKLKVARQIPLPLKLPTKAEYRARIAKAALSGFQQGDDLLSIGIGCGRDREENTPFDDEGEK